MPKLIIQVPCYNEAETLAITLTELPRDVPGFDCVEWLIIDDGSDDETVNVAIESGVDHIVRHNQNRGLACAFMSGLDACLHHGADVVVNTDADNQYCAADIPKLTAPVLAGQADMVIGARPISEIEHFSPLKKLLQKIGSWVVRMTSKTNVADAPSGFRAISRSAAQQFVLFSDYTYALETIIQSGQKNISIRSVPIRVNANLRPSRLITSLPAYVRRSILTIIRIFVIYRPARFFGAIALVLFTAGFLLGLRIPDLLVSRPWRRPRAIPNPGGRVAHHWLSDRPSGDPRRPDRRKQKAARGNPLHAKKRRGPIEIFRDGIKIQP